jgi:hypothetical protein
MKKRKSTFANFLLNSFRKNFKVLCASLALWACAFTLLFFIITRLVVVIASSRISLTRVERPDPKTRVSPPFSTIFRNWTRRKA